MSQLRWLKFVLVAVMVAAAWLGLSPLFRLPPVTALPQTVAATVVMDRFSAARAMRDVAVIALEPHPSGSLSALAVRDQLVQIIAGLGLNPELQDTVIDGYDASAHVYTHAVVHNVIARLPGANHTPGVLVVAHYDSAPTSPGASDCGACVGVALETLRVIKAGMPLEHDVIFLFSDGATLGAQGDRAFAQQHPWVRDISVSVVLGGQGSGGPALLYTTSRDSTPFSYLVLPGRLASSLVSDLAWRVSGSSGSDGLPSRVLPPGFGLTTIGEQTSYHTMRDSFATLDPRAVQSLGENAVALVRQLANQDRADAGPQVQQVAFTLAPDVLVTYPSLVTLAPILLTLTGLLLLLMFGRRGVVISIRDTLIGMLVWGLALMSITAIVTFAWWLIRLTNRNLHAYLLGITYQSNVYLIGMLALGMAVFCFIYWLFRRVQLFNHMLAILFWWEIAALLSLILLPGMSYLFAWPPMLGLAVLAWLIYSKNQSLVVHVAVLITAPALAILLFAPAIWLLTGFAGRIETSTGAPLLALPVIPAVWVFGLLLPQFSFITDRSRRPVMAVVGLVVFAITTFYAGTQVGFDETHPRTNTVIYQLEADAHVASWITVDDSRMGRGTSGQRDEWTRQFIAANGQTIAYNPWLVFAPGDWPATRTGAPVIDLPRPVLTMTEAPADSSGRHMDLTMSWPAGAYDGLVTITAGGPILSATLNGAGLMLPAQLNNRLVVALLNPPGDAIDITLTTTAGPVTAQAQVRRLGLPVIPDQSVSPRFGWMIAAPFDKSADSSIVIVKLQLP